MNQSYQRVEIIVADDGSTDGGKTAEIARSYGDKIRYIEKENDGIETSVPTTIKTPTYCVDSVLHYVVDHTPALFYKTFTWENSSVIWKYLEQLIERRPDKILGDAEIIRNGHILDDEICWYQNR